MSDVPVELTVHQLETTFGVLFIGYIISMVAYGFTFFQTYIYFSRYPMDRWGIKATVASVCLLDTVNSTLISHTLYRYLVTFFPLTTGLDNATPTFCAEIGFSILAVFIVQMFYSYRIWTGDPDNSLIYMLLKLIFVWNHTFDISFVYLNLRSWIAVGLVFTSELIRNTSFASMEAPLTKGLMTASQGLTLLSSALSAVALFFYLSRIPVLNPPENLFEKVITYVISRGTLAIVLQLCFLITFITMPGKFIWMPFHLFTSKAFINSLLTMLNFRVVSNGQGYTEEEAIVRKASNGTSTFSVNGRRVCSSFRFGGMESKINITVSHRQSVERENGEVSKVLYEDSDTIDNNWHQRRRKEAQSRNSDIELEYLH